MLIGSGCAVNSDLEASFFFSLVFFFPASGFFSGAFGGVGSFGAGLEVVLVAFAGTGLEATFASGLVLFAGALFAGVVARAGDFW